jgi:membrane-bound lytic murein transglycosylase D
MIAMLVIISPMTIIAHNTYDFDLETLRADLTGVESIVDMRFTSEVQSYLKNYLVNNREKSERIVNRMMLYFPMIEKKLAEHKLPDELKYLAIVESGLDPHARSRSGALGLWQIMAPTAGDLDVRMYHSVDERKDPYRSTDAALHYLSRLFDRFGDWELALAAYNGGPNRISKIMTNSDESDYWILRKDLPRETANYIPAFIAASYVFSEFAKHGFIPERGHPDFHFTSKVEIFNHKVYLKDVAKLMKINIDSLKFINPMYKRDYIPKSDNGYNLILPNRCLKYFHRLQDTLQKSELVKLAELEELESFQSFYPDSLQDIYLNTVYIVQNKENLFTVARMFNVDVLQLKYWNNLPSLHVDHGMLIDLPLSIVEGRFLIKDYKKVRLTEKIGYHAVDDVEISGASSSIVLAANRACLDARHALQQEVSRAAQTVTIAKGIPLQALMTQDEFSNMSAKQLSDITVGSQVCTQ